MDTSYATVSSKGVVRGKKEGSVKVCAQIDGVKYYCKVKVKRAMTTTAPSTMHIRSRKAIPVTFKLSGKLNFKLSKANIVSVKFGSWKKDKIHLYVTPLRKGTVTLTITNTKNNEKLRFTIYSKK